MSVDSIHTLARTVEAGTVLFEEGTTGGGLIILLSGRLQVLKNEEVVGSITEAGSYVGESTFVTGKVRTATVIAETSATIIRLTGQQSAEFLQKREIEGKLVKTVTERLSSANEAILEKSKRARELEEVLFETLNALKEVCEDFAIDEGVSDPRSEVLKRVRTIVNKVNLKIKLDKRVTI